MNKQIRIIPAKPFCMGRALRVELSYIGETIKTAREINAAGKETEYAYDGNGNMPKIIDVITLYGIFYHIGRVCSY